MVTDGSHFSPNTTPSGYPYITVRDIKDGAIDFENCAFVNKSSFEELQRNGCAPLIGDVLFSKDGTVGKVARVASPNDFVVLSSLAILRPNPSLIDSAYLSYVLRSPSFLEAAIGQKTGVAIRRIILKNLKQIPVPYPSIPEQRRIVAILDEAFEAIATAKTNTEKNLQNARELFSSRMQILFEQNELWERVQLEELLARRWITSHLDGNHGSDYPRKEEFVEAGVPYIAASAIKGGIVDFGEAKYLSLQRAATIRKGIAKDRDVLFAHNATVGPVAVLNTTEETVILGTSLTYYRCNTQHIHPEYLAHYMVSPAFTSQYTQVMKQSTRNQVPITKQREFFHVIPPIEVQKRIADDLDELSMQTERLADIDARRLIALDELKKSLLHQAFTGQLTAKSTDKQVAEVA